MTTTIPTPQLRPHIPTCLTCRTPKNAKQQALSQNQVQISCVSHLIEDGVDPTFVQRQAGHSWASTTAGYTTVGADHANRMLRAAVGRVFVTAPQGNSQ
jgi:site-specific recombinase XerD